MILEHGLLMFLKLLTHVQAPLMTGKRYVFQKYFTNVSNFMVCNNDVALKKVELTG